MSVYPIFARQVVLPIADKIMNTHICRDMNLLEKTQWWSKKDLNRYRDKKLKSLVNYAYRNVPFYHRIFRERDLFPEDIKTKKDLTKLPIINKRVIKENQKEFISKEIDKLTYFKLSTGGTTGAPLNYYLSSAAKSRLVAVKNRSLSWGGYNYGDRKVTLAGSSLVPNQKIGSLKKIRLIAERNLALSSVHLSPPIMEKYALRIQKYNVQFLRGYPSSIYTFAKFLRENDLEIKFKSVFTTAEVLNPKHRNFIENTFDCEVYDHYGCADGNAHACECELRSGYHTSPETSALEIVDNDEEVASHGEEGKLVWTDLNNYAMPFIRYSPEDIGITTDEKCNCGRELPMLSSISGRTTDIISFENGVTLAGPALTLIFKDFNIEQYQIEQLSGNSLLIKLVKSPSYLDVETEKIAEIMQYHCGSGVELRIEFMERIPLTDGSKFRFIINSVKQ